MKKHTSTFKLLLMLMLIFSTLGFYSTVQAAAIAVGLQVNESQTGLEVTTRGTCQNQPNPNGCIHVTGKVQINFNLQNSRCSQNESWQLGQVTLATSNKGQPGGIGPVAASDFHADEVSGVVTPVTSSGSHILIRDNNSQAYDIWYSISASCGGKTIVTDPRIENGGVQ